MQRIAAGPAPEDVARYGNFTISFWAPLDAKEHAHRQFHAFLAGVLGGATQVLLFGHAPGKLAGLPPEVLPPRLASLRASLVPDEPGNAFQPLNVSALAQYRDLLAEGRFILRRRVSDAHGQARIESILAGTLLLHTGAAELCRALDAHVPHPAVRISAHVVVNPWAGLRQNQRAPLRAHIDADPGRVTVMWSGANRSFSLFAPAPLLQKVLAALTEAPRA